MRFLFVPVLFFFSGFSGLMYEVLWMKNLRLMLGSTAEATSLTLAAFFLGIAIGNRWWGNRMARYSSGLRVYAFLEAGIGLTALAIFFLIPVYTTLFPHALILFSGSPLGMTLFKFILGGVFLFPPCFLMGGTFPAMTQSLCDSPIGLGKHASLLYGLNTLGGAAGALIAGFLSIRWIGYQNSYWVAVSLSFLLAAVSLLVSKRWRVEETTQIRVDPQPTIKGTLGWGEIRFLAIVSGFATLSLEVLWTRMFEQVLHNSVYTFTLILVTFLTCLGTGGLIASFLARMNPDPLKVLVVIGCLSGILVGLTPFMFSVATDGLKYLGSNSGWIGYLVSILTVAGVTVFIPGILIGTLFPYLLRVAEPYSETTGKTVGTLASLNTIGGVVGALAGSFLFLEVFGLWNGIRAIGSIYFWIALIVGVHLLHKNRMGVVFPVGGLLALVLVLNPSSLPLVRVSGEKEVIRFWEGSAGTVAVVDSPKSRSILVNNYYTLGGRMATKYQETMSHIPLLAHNNPKDVFYIGMGTGITAGASLLHPVITVTISELIPEAVTASREFFQEDTRGLFKDSRVEIVVEDGRFFLAATEKRYDAIIGDLFIPWKAGTGNLYSLEHYRNSLNRLNQGGVYAQWIPLYQVSDFELGVIARTMLEVFPYCTVWRGDFFKNRSILLLLGHKNLNPIDPERVEREITRLSKEPTAFPFGNRKEFWMHYCGSISKEHSPFGNYPMNLDDRPIIEFSSPITMRRERAGELDFVRGTDLLELMTWIIREGPLENDPYLSDARSPELDWIREGLEKHRSTIQ